MRERRLVVTAVVALVMLLAWRGPDLLPAPSAEPRHVSLAIDLRQAEVTFTVVSGAAALLKAAR